MSEKILIDIDQGYNHNRLFIIDKGGHCQMDLTFCKSIDIDLLTKFLKERKAPFTFRALKKTSKNKFKVIWESEPLRCVNG